MKQVSISRTAFLTRWRVAIFVGLTFTISYLFGIPFNMFVSSLLVETNEVIYVLLPRLVTVYGPFIAAVVVTRFGAGHFTTKTLLNKLIPEGRYIWWCLAIPSVFFLVTFISFAIAGVSVAQLGSFLATDWHWLIFQLLAQFFIVGIGEELGWRGWLLPTLAQRHSLLRCVFMIMAIWGIWHLPVFFNGYQVVIPWLMMLGSLAFITTWVWLKVNGNIFVLAIVHASFNAPEAFFENRLNDVEGGKELILAGWTTLGYAYVAMAIIVILSNRKIWRLRLS